MTGGNHDSTPASDAADDADADNPDNMNWTRQEATMLDNVATLAALSSIAPYAHTSQDTIWKYQFHRFENFHYSLKYFVLATISSDCI